MMEWYFGAKKHIRALNYMYVCEDFLITKEIKEAKQLFTHVFVLGVIMTQL